MRYFGYSYQGQLTDMIFVRDGDLTPDERASHIADLVRVHSFLPADIAAVESDNPLTPVVTLPPTVVPAPPADPELAAVTAILAHDDEDITDAEAKALAIFCARRLTGVQPTPPIEPEPV